MVTRTRAQLGLRVAFYRADVLTDTEVARTEEDARDSALAIIGRLDFLLATGSKSPIVLWPLRHRLLRSISPLRGQNRLWKIKMIGPIIGPQAPKTCPPCPLRRSRAPSTSGAQ
jgi:hypothetical protein